MNNELTETQLFIALSMALVMTILIAMLFTVPAPEKKVFVGVQYICNDDDRAIMESWQADCMNAGGYGFERCRRMAIQAFCDVDLSK
jgi:hypothetical protein